MIFAFENPSYLVEFEAEFKKALALESGAQGYYLMKKTKGKKSRDTVPLKYLYSMGIFAVEIFLLDFPFQRRHRLTKSL
jgi:hypothetical protein